MTYKSTVFKQKFGSRAVVSLGIIGGLLWVMGGEAKAQYQGAYGANFNNPISATLNIRMQGLSQMASMRDAIHGSAANKTAQSTAPTRKYAQALSLSSIGVDTAERGQKLIADGKASARFSGTGYFVVRDFERRNERFEVSMQKNGLSPVDLADVVTYAIGNCLESWGQGDAAQFANNPQFKALKAQVSPRLLKDARIQGLNNFEKNALSETLCNEAAQISDLYDTGKLLNAPDNINQAKARATRLCELWLGVRPDQITLTPTGLKMSGAAKQIAKPVSSTTNRVTNELESTAAPTTISFEQAKLATNFKQSPSLITPAIFTKELDGTAQERAKTEALLSQLINDVRSDMKTNAQSNLPVDNVARAQVYALTQLYPLALTHEGDQIGEGVPELTMEQSQAMRRQFAMALGNDQRFRSLTDHEKQEIYEMYLLIPTFAGVFYNSALQQGDVQGQKTARDMARQNIQAILGATPEELHFSETGVSIG